MQLGLETKPFANGRSRSSKLWQWLSNTYFSSHNLCCRVDGRNGFTLRSSSGKLTCYFFSSHANVLSTLFAFYSLSISSAVLLGTQIPLSSRHLGLAFPSSDSLWRARNEVEWARQLPLWEPDLELTLTFPNAVHTFLTGNIGFIQNDLTNLSLFSQHVVLCAIIEAIESSRRFPLNYSSIEGWISGSISTFSSRTHFLQILKLWNDFYQQPFEGTWVHGDHARPRVESVMLFKFVVDKLTNSDAPMDNPDIRFAADQAADSLLCASKVGIMEVSNFYHPPGKAPHAN